ncbi:MAG TPA: tetraacyldisaccharide 4'-kinase [Phycisphaerae bacterium]|nr:tetraacyldisaccharide 4'-kinase [Phycisphaerae bacterium]
MDADRSAATSQPPRDRQGRWLALVSGRTQGVVASLARAGLWVLSGFYRLGLAVANVRWRLPGMVRRAPCPVISIGNLTVGGTGKTPMAACLADLVMQLGGAPLIVSRGYGGGEGQPNDEARELQRLCPDVPHVQDADRVRAIRRWAGRHPCDIAILDDGFQHRRCARDLDIVLIDALRPFGYGHLLPRGLLREPLSALRRADVVVITRADSLAAAALAALKVEVGRLVPGDTPVLLAEHRPIAIRLPDGSQRDLAWLAGREVAAACAIANPQAFRMTLEQLGAQVAPFNAFRDHHVYTHEELNRLMAGAEATGAKTLVTTGKDFVKWFPMIDTGRIVPCVEVAAVEIALRVTGGEDVLRRRVAALLPGSEDQGEP